MRLTPRAGVDRIVGVRDGMLAIRVAAPPVDGAANAALLRLIAHELRLPSGSVRLVLGASARHKLVDIDAPIATIAARWPELGL